MKGIAPGKARLAVTISEVMKNRIKEQTDARGINESTFIQLVLSAYFDGQDVMAQMANLPDFLKQIREMQETQSKMLNGGLDE